MASMNFNRQRVVGALLDWATDGAKGVQVGSSRYNVVVEKHDIGNKRYSSCGDLAHWLLYRLGVRYEWINRHEHYGWRVGMNLNRLAPPPIGKCGPAQKQLDVKRLGPGDVLLVTTRFGGHAMCVKDIVGNVIYTAEYGQPGGLQKTHELTPEFINRVFSHIRLDTLQLTGPLDLSCLDLTGEEIDALTALT